MNSSDESQDSTKNSLEEAYRVQIEEAIRKESERRVTEAHDPKEISRLQSLSLVELAKSDDADFVPALMARLGPVRAALDGHGGGIGCY
ncbi:MAG: hypothetical protein CMA76_00090 [Euryarchaeota archaeon]|nr:hypothetical protein [Euryarchaeota archaeon]